MSANKFVTTTTEEVTCYSNGSSRTVLAVQASANIALKVIGWSVCFDGLNVTSEPFVVELARQTTVGNGIGTSINKYYENDSDIQAIAKYNFTTEPAKGDVLDSFNVHPQSGIDVKYPENEQPIISPDGFVGLIVRGNSDVKCLAKIICEE